MKVVTRVLSAVLLCTAVSFSVTGYASAEETCRASWYGPGFHGKKMANGDRFNQNDVTVVAHKSLPFGTVVRITNLDNGRSIKATVQDRGPYHKGRCVDLSKAGANKLGFIGAGTARVRVQTL
jgi:rare lipoprotein A